MNNVSKNVLQTIEKEHVRPKPRWTFLVHNWLIWTVFIVSVIIGSLAFSVIIFYLVDFEWETYERLNSSFWAFLFTSLPYVWIVIAAILIAVAYYYFKHTKKGYRFGFTTVIIASLLFSLCGGLVLHAFNVGEYLDDLATTQIPFYPRMIRTPMERWANPKMGMMGGEVEELRLPELILRDFRGDQWTIFISDNTRMPKQLIKEKMFLRIIGNMMSDHEFEAHDIRLWLRRAPKTQFLPPPPKK